MGGEKPPLVLIAGPTASGKSAHALTLAERIGGTIINADASQIYRDLPILSAMPTAEERRRVPHRLFGTIDGAEACTAAHWAMLAGQAIAEAWEEGRVPILVGGSGLYQRTLLDGIAPVPEIPPEIRSAVRAMAPGDVRAALETEDPVMATRLHANDPQRSARALEVVRATCRSLAEWQNAPPARGLRDSVRLDVQLINLPRDILQERIARRIQLMWDAGAADEVATLARRQLPMTLPVMRAIGVPPLLAFLEERITAAAAIDRWLLDTRRYAKRQETWYRNQTSGWLTLQSA